MSSYRIQTARPYIEKLKTYQTLVSYFWFIKFVSSLFMSDKGFTYHVIERQIYINTK